jgi:hypothetical protein
MRVVSGLHPWQTEYAAYAADGYNADLVVLAKVAELVDALDLGSSGATRGSSTLPFRTSIHWPGCSPGHFLSGYFKD